jgi:5-methylcytosine-specific restriction endonuclease McrA
MKQGRAGYSIYRSARWASVRQAAKRRDGFKCTECGARGRLEVHHRIPVRQAPDLAFDLGNLACLCPPCHTKRTRLEMGLDEPKPAQRAWRNLLAQGIENASVC